jgi:hypothetical protein
MKRILLSIVLLLATIVSIYSKLTFIVRDRSPKCELTFEAVNPKFVPENLSTDSIKVFMNYTFQIPDSLLHEFTTEELALYTSDYPEFSMTLMGLIEGRKILDFNGFNELTQRENWSEELIDLMETYHSKGEESKAQSLLVFLSAFNVYARMKLEQQKHLLQTIKNILDKFKIDENIGRYSDFDYFYLRYAGLIAQTYYPNLLVGGIQVYLPFMSTIPEEKTPQEIHKNTTASLQRSINEGELFKLKK